MKGLQPVAPQPLRLVLGIAALAAGAFAMGASVLFVRLADVGPFASAFWRAALALPVLLVWAVAADGRGALVPDRASLLAGVFFAGDLFFWHLAILGTSVANAAVLATTSPVWVALFAWLVLRIAITRATLAGLALCLAGAGALIGRSFHLEPAHLLGDAAGLVTAIFFAAYFLAIGKARRFRGAGAVTLISTAATAAILFLVALAVEPTLWPASASGAAALLGLALVSQVGGQGLMAVGLSVVPPIYGALVFFLEVVSAAALGWLVLGEALGPLQGIGMGLVLFGLWVARPGQGK
ncbi:DMT family transporter [Roseixanthobacter pseudopolyaromaticivorans]|uniref:DMT family transporter n=1 Tax=Xanthobacteraceae TaxID=335928 RepID=UPI0037287B0C